jgi:hypothetical protein
MKPQFIKHDPPTRYSKASVYRDFIFLAGEDFKDAKTQKVRGTTAAEQAEYLFQNMKATLESLGSGLEDVIKTTDARHADGYWEGRKKFAACPAEHPDHGCSIGRTGDAHRNRSGGRNF